MDLLNIKPKIILPNLSLKNNFNNLDKLDKIVDKKNDNNTIKKNIYPDLNKLNLNEEYMYNNLNINIEKNNEKKIDLDSEKIYNYIYKIKFIKEYNKEENEYRNNFLFNENHERFFSYGKKLEFDPLIFENEFKLYPDYVKYIYYTKISPKNKLVRLSRLTNLYLNLCFKNQNFASFYRVMYYPLYDLITKKQNIISEEDIKKHFIKDNKINNYGNIEIFFNKENKIIRDIDYNHINIIKYHIDDVQPTFWAYKNFYDYIPICFIPSNYYKFMPFLKHYPDCKKLLMSNICFHNNDCHDYWCKTHNYNENQSIYYLHTHDYFQELYKFNKNQLIDINKLSFE